MSDKNFLTVFVAHMIKATHTWC